MPTSTQAAPERATADVLAPLRRLVAENSRRWKAVVRLEAGSLAVAAPLAYLWLAFFLDNQFHLPLAGRLLASLGLVVGITCGGVHLARRWRKLHLSEDQVALAIERGTPGGVQNRLINAMQLGRASGVLSEAVVAENCTRLHEMHLQQAARLRPALIRLGVAGLLILFGLAFWLLRPEQFTNAATRIFLPLAQVDPLYRTVLVVEPGDIEASGDAVIQVTIQGERPKNIIVQKNIDGQRSAETIPVPEEGPVNHTFRDVTQSFDYAVQGGDFTSPTYRVLVPRKPSVARVLVTYQYPAYTGLPDRALEQRGGDLESLQGTRARLTFVFDQDLERAAVVLDKKTAQPLDRKSAREFSGEIVLQDATSYRLEFASHGGDFERSGAYAIRILKDQEPKLELTGLERRMETPIDVVLPLQIAASDDFGLTQVGLSYRKAKAGQAHDDGWQAIEVWPGQRKTAFSKKDYALTIAALPIAEGDKLEIALRAVDTDPLRNGDWTTGAVHELTIGGDGALLQHQYEQIVRSEADLKKLIRSQQESLGQTVVWIRKLDGGGELRWDDPKNLAALHAGVTLLGADQGKAKEQAATIAQAMAPQTGNLRIALAMLADTEIVRLQRILKAVESRDKPQDKRAALTDARLTQERIIRSLEEMLEQHQSFRSDWELSNMIPFTKILAERQAKMRDESRKHASPLPTGGEGPGVRGPNLSMHRRQSKVLDLCKLIQPAFTGLATRLEDQEPHLSQAFLDGSRSLAGNRLQESLARAADAARAGLWSDAVTHQTQAAVELAAIHERLRKAQMEAAQKALAALKAKLKSDLDAQKELDKLPPGTAEAFLKEFPENLKLEDLMRIQDIAGAKKRTDKNASEEPDFKNQPLLDVDRSQIELKEDSGVRQDPYSLKLGSVAEKTPILKMYKDKDNVVKPFVQEKFDDLVGKLLDETEELHKNYQSIKLSTNQNNNDPGEIGKVGGALNSTGAVTATGNKKPPTTESGGLSRTGRQGARATGMVADDEGVNRRGRDQALDGQEQVADQAGTIKMKKSDDMQKDTSTGVGGKKVESDDNHFSLHDTGKWKDEFAKRMEKPQKKQYIVERQGDKIDAKTAALLRDLTSQQEQVIERLKAIKKELRNLYLPTEHLDELAGQLESNLASLKEQPDPELFRQQMQTLDKLRGAMRVFRSANASFQPSLPRERAIKGRVLDDPGAPGLPGYEEAVRQYYRKLAEQ